MNQGKLEVVKQEMAGVNVNILGIQARVLEWGAIAFSILGISELKWTGMGEFNSDDHYIYYGGQESLRRNRVAIIVNKESKMQYLDAISKRQNDFCSFPSQTIQYHSNPSLCPNQ